MKCKLCGKEYHCCTSCDINDDDIGDLTYSEGWCSVECWEKSGEFSDIDFRWQLLDGLNETHKEALLLILDGDDTKTRYVRELKGYLE